MLYPMKKLLLGTTFYLSFFLHHLATSQTIYVPVDNIALDCGSATDGTAYGRTWIADANSKFSRLDQQIKPLRSTALESLTTVNNIPYRTARLSRSQFTYTFPVTPGQKFVRLHFFPATYDKFSRSAAFFSVKAGAFTLVSNFSALLHAQSQRSEVLVKEFILNVADDQALNLTFTPTPGMPDAYSFINGIEIVSMPTNLYYTPSGDQGVLSVGLNNRRQIDNSTALELMYRVNMAQSSISPKQDTGMYRSWSTDNDYLTDSRNSVLLSNDSIQLVYKDDLNRYAAPEQVYKSGRSMGPDKSVNVNYSLTWEFPVDSVFTYLVRLHFCDFIPLFTEQGDRVFQIIIANQTADDHADIMWWSGANGAPVHRDFAVLIGAKGSVKVQNLSVALHTLPDFFTSYSDVILNGLELFKLSNFYSLASPNPDPIPTSPPSDSPSSQQSSKSKINGKTVYAIVGGAVAGLVALSVLFFFIFCRRRRVKDSSFNQGGSWFDAFYSTKSDKTKRSYLPSDLCRHFSLAEIKAATNNFDRLFIIGVGGFGNVYKGFINDGAITVAIKRLNPGSQQGANEFKTEIEMLSQLRHLHLVSLIGYCHEDGEMILVYDYMSRGTLRDHLYNSDNHPLSWTERLAICIGAARGLQYLHSGAKHTIIHRDVKTTNILLDEKWVAKVSDFGLSKVGPTSMSKAHVSTVVKGSFGYLDPEYYRTQQLTEKSDVYSFGVVLWEVLCARPPVSRSASAGNKPVSLAELARQSYSNGTVEGIIDPYLIGQVAADCLKKFSEVAMSCLHDNGTERPSMNDVVWALEFALQLQESAAESIKLGEDNVEIELDDKGSLRVSAIDDSSDVLFSGSSGLLIGSRVSKMTTSSSDDHGSLSKSSEMDISGAVFSEIMQPKGR